MPDSLTSLLDSPDDGAVVSGVYDRLVKHYGPSVDVDTIPAEHRTVLLVEYTSGVVLNGGFTALLGSELPGDPDFQYLLRAYEAVGGAAAEAIGRAFELYRDRIPPADRRDRLTLFAKGNDAARGGLNTDFFKAHDGLVRDLASYIRRHRAAFADLGGRPPKPRPREKRLTWDEAGVRYWRLPRWANVAFSARCARIVVPLWDDAWPDAPPEHRAAVERAIRLAELTAAAGEPVGDLKNAHSDAVSAAGAAMVTQLGVRPDDDPPDPPARDPQLASLVANAAAHTTDPLRNPTDQGSYGYAKGAIEIAGRDDLMDQLQEDFRRLRRIVRDGGWTDRTPVPPEVFDPGYEPPRKPWWKLW